MSTPLTGQILSLIRESYATRGIAPTQRELRASVGCASISTVSHHINKLIAQGKLERGAKYAGRALRLVERKASLDEQAAVFQELGALCVWTQAADGTFTGFEAWFEGERVGIAGNIKVRAL